jgi:RNA polymerase sigma-70 factor (ECF subfamily)
MSDSLPDEEILRRIGAGDVSAAGVLYDRYARALFPMALRILRDRAEAEDLLHDAFIAVAERAGQYSRERGTVAAWLITLVRNLTIDRTRRRERRGAIARDVVAFEPTEPVADPETLVIGQSSSAKVNRALDALPDVQRATLVAAFFEGLSYPEIAERENIPIGTVKSRAARALATLREALMKEGFDANEAAEAMTMATAPTSAGRGSS